MSETQQTTKVDRLYREFTEQVGLEPVDAYRSTFTALAVASGWTKARVGRFLGISRARVGQRVDKLEHYAAAPIYDVPTIQAVMRKAAVTDPVRGSMDDIIAYTTDEWSDLDFARALCERFV